MPDFYAGSLTWPVPLTIVDRPETWQYTYGLFYYLTSMLIDIQDV